MSVEINLLGVLVAAIVNFGLGMLWYSTILFGKEWMSEMNMTLEQIKAKKPLIPFMGAFLAGLVTALVLEIFIKATDYLGALNGGVIGLTAGIGFVATTFASGFLFEGKSMKIYFITAGYHLASFTAMGVVLGIMD